MRGVRREKTRSQVVVLQHPAHGLVVRQDEGKELLPGDVGEKVVWVTPRRSGTETKPRRSTLTNHDSPLSLLKVRHGLAPEARVGVARARSIRTLFRPGWFWRRRLGRRLRALDSFREMEQEQEFLT